MAKFKVILRSGQVSTVEDNRSLQAIASELCQNGFVVVQRLGGGYSGGMTEVALLERAVSSIEPAE